MVGDSLSVRRPVDTGRPGIVSAPVEPPLKPVEQVSPTVPPVQPDTATAHGHRRGRVPGNIFGPGKKSVPLTPEELEKAAVQAFIRGDFEQAVTLYVRLAESYRPMGNLSAAGRALREAIDIQYQKLHRLDPQLVLSADKILQEAGKKDSVAVQSARDLDAEMNRRLELLWTEWDIPQLRPSDWRQAVSDPSLKVFLNDVHGHREAERRLTQMAGEFKEKAAALLHRGSAYETMQAYRAAGEIYLKIGQPLEAARAFRRAAETAYNNLERLDPDLIRKACGAYEAAARDPATRSEGERGQKEWSDQLQGYVDALWKQLQRPGSAPLWSQALNNPELVPHFDDVQGRQASERQRREVAQRKIEEKGFFDKVLDGAAVVGGVIWDTTKKAVNGVVVEPVKTAYEYYTDPNFSLGRFARDTRTVGSYVADQTGKAVSGAVKTMSRPLVTAYEYYTDPNFSLKRFVRDTGMAKDYLAERLSTSPPPPPVPVNPGARPLDPKVLDQDIAVRTGTTASPNRVRLYVDGDEAFPAMHDLINSARSSIHVAIYMFDNDRTGYDLADALIARAREGVEVRVLVDKMGTRIVNSSLQHEPGDRGNILDYLRRNGVTVLEEDNAFLASDHRKVVVVDGRRGITGGMNFGNAYSDQWHDFMVQVEGPAVRPMQSAFLDSWKRAGGAVNLKTDYFPSTPPAAPDEAIATRVLVTSSGVQGIKTALFAAIDRARHHIYIEHAYLTDDQVVEKLVEARRRGVDVRVIIPGQTDMAIYDRANRVSVNRLLEAGAEVYFHKRMIHGKAVTIDGQWTTIGSANLSRRSLNANQEMNFAVTDPRFARLVEERIFEPDMEPAQSHRITRPLEGDRWDDILNWLADKAADRF